MDRIEQQAFTNPWNRQMLHAAVLNVDYDVRVLRQTNARVIGFYIAHRVLDRCNLDNLAIQEDARRLGYGSALLRDWIGRAWRAHNQSLSLQVNTANLGAQRLYREFQFKATRLLVSYYPNGEDAYEMTRDISKDGLCDIEEL